MDIGLQYNLPSIFYIVISTNTIINMDNTLRDKYKTPVLYINTFVEMYLLCVSHNNER